LHLLLFWYIKDIRQFAFAMVICLVLAGTFPNGMVLSTACSNRRDEQPVVEEHKPYPTIDIAYPAFRELGSRRL